MANRNSNSLNLGIIHKPMLLFGGVYSNVHALSAFQEIAKQEGIDAKHIICTGDVVGYCAHPQETVDAIRDWGVHVIKGNVEQQLAAEADDCGCDFSDGGACDMYSRTWYPFAQRTLDSSAIQWMHSLPDHIEFQIGGKSAFVLHGGYSNISEFIFSSSDWAMKEAILKTAQAKLIIAGHCGLPFTQLGQSGAWLNPGVIGMPANDATPRVWYMKLEPSKEHSLRISHHAYTYDHAAAAKAMQELGLPEAYAKTLSTGLWDNCEILPDHETQQQGQALALDGAQFSY